MDRLNHKPLLILMVGFFVLFLILFILIQAIYRFELSVDVSILKFVVRLRYYVFVLTLIVMAENIFYYSKYYYEEMSISKYRMVINGFVYVITLALVTILILTSLVYMSVRPYYMFDKNEFDVVFEKDAFLIEYTDSTVNLYQADGHISFIPTNRIPLVFSNECQNGSVELININNQNVVFQFENCDVTRITLALDSMDLYQVISRIND